MGEALRCAAALSVNRLVSQAVREVCEQALHQLGAEPHLAFWFAAGHTAELSTIASEIRTALGCEAVLGCTGESIVGNDREVEGEPALSLWVAHLPGATIETLALRFQRTAEGGTFVGWPEALLDSWPDDAALLLLAEPYTFPADALLERMNEDHPGVPILGGMASGGAGPGENHVVLGSEVLAEGAVGVLLSGAVRVRSVVSQGCRPIGRPMVITKSERNMILELGGQPPLQVLNELFSQLTPSEQQLAQGGLHVGRVTTEYKERFGQGDFLIRNVLGADPASGAILVGDYLRTGQTVQFHVRDERTADEELRQLCQTAAEQSAAPVGALLFTCNGRGTRMFSSESHDAGVIRGQWPDLPLAGFFAQGEIGPVGPANFLHGFTASVALLEAAAKPRE